VTPFAWFAQALTQIRILDIVGIDDPRKK